MYQKRKERTQIEKYHSGDNTYLSKTKQSDVSENTISNESGMKISKHRVSLRLRIKRFWYGMGKESKRISWAKPKELGKGMLTVFIIIVVLAFIFFGISRLIIYSGAVV